MNNDVVLSVNDLKINFYNNKRCNKVLKGVSFDIKKGKIMCIVGESGCGKSVTANAIMGLLPDLSRIEGGTIDFNYNGEIIHISELNRKGKQMRKLRGEGMAMIFQDPMTVLNPVLSVGYQLNENLLYHKKVKNKKEGIERSIKQLKSMGIPLPERRVKEYPHQFSGGMIQRAMIAMAMSCQPRLLIADEPTTALDVTIQAQIFELMLDLKNNNDTGILFITHDMGVVAELADDVAVMYMGNVIECGDVRKVMANPVHPYTRALLKSIPVLGKGKQQILEPIRGSTPEPYSKIDGCQFAPRCDYAKEICRQQMPNEEEIEPNHSCRCFYKIMDKGVL